MVHFLNPRLQLSYKLLCKYDIVDKEFLNFIDSSKLDSIKIIYTTTSLEKKGFNIILNKEFSAFQRFGCQLKSKNQKMNFSKFIVTLRNSVLYTYLELFLHTYLLDKHTFFKLNNNYFNLFFVDKMYNPFFINKFLSNLIYSTFFNQDSFIYIFFKSVGSTNIKKQLNYYFIPTYLSCNRRIA